VSDHEIRVGLSVSVSGRFQFQGQQALHGILLWQSHANTQGGIWISGGMARSVRLIWYDDGSRVNRTRENVLRLIRNDSVDILLGPYSSSLTLVAAEIAEEHKKIIWNYGGASDEIFGRRWRYMIGIASPASDYLRALPHWLAKEYPKLSRICVLYSGKGTFGRQVARGILASSQETGQSVELVPFDAPIENTEAALSILFDIRPEAVILAATFQDELAIMRTRPRWPARVRAVAAVSAGISSFHIELGWAAEEVFGPSQWEPGVSFPEIIGPGSDWFTDKCRKRFGDSPDYVTAASFATGLIVSECIRRAASLNDDALRSAAAKLDCNTFYGHFRIDPESGKQVGHRVLLIGWKGSKKTILC
jgi:branched-chain amino acid transport system substrate-binding protein